MVQPQTSGTAAVRFGMLCSNAKLKELRRAHASQEAAAGVVAVDLESCLSKQWLARPRPGMYLLSHSESEKRRRGHAAS